jgi:hypothetical protein
VVLEIAADEAIQRVLSTSLSPFPSPYSYDIPRSPVIGPSNDMVVRAAARALILRIAVACLLTAWIARDALVLVARIIDRLYAMREPRTQAIPNPEEDVGVQRSRGDQANKPKSRMRIYPS